MSEKRSQFFPIVSATLTRTFSATHALDIAGGCKEPHSHDYTARFGFRHEMQPTTGTIGSKPLEEWNRCCQAAIEKVADRDLNEVLAPRPPTLEFLTLYLFAQMPAYFDWIEVSSYEPQLSMRIDRERGARVEWLT